MNTDGGHPGNADQDLVDSGNKGESMDRIRSPSLSGAEASTGLSGTEVSTGSEKGKTLLPLPDSGAVPSREPVIFKLETVIPTLYSNCDPGASVHGQACHA